MDSAKTMVAGKMDDLVDIQELGAFVTQDGDQLMVTNLMDASARPKGYEDIDIRLNDIVLMANAKKLASLKDLQTLYTTAAPGTTIKLGIKRGETMMIVPFDKIDPEKLPKRKMVIRRGGSGDMLIIPQVGLVFGTKGKKIVLETILDNAKESFPEADLKEGDEVVTINGKACTSFKDFSSTYDKLAVGKSVELVVSRGGNNTTLKFQKPEDKGGPQMIRKTIGK